MKVWGKKWILITASLCYMGFLLMLHRIPRFTEGVHGPLVIDGSLRTEYGLGIPSYIDVSANLSASIYCMAGGAVFVTFCCCLLLC